MDTRRHNDFFTPLDAARGLAALAVVAFHLRYGEDIRQATPLLHAIASNGFLGVPVFFVVSGYCLATSSKKTLARKQSVWRFLYRRFRRIYPPLWGSILFVVAMPWIKHYLLCLAGSDRSFPQPLYLGMDFWDWAGIGTLLQVFRYGSIPVDEKFSAINVVYWSLAIEVQFYIIMAIAIAFRRAYYWIILSLAFFGLGALALRDLFAYQFNSGLFIPHWPLFALGILLFELRSRDYTLRRWLSMGRAALTGAVLIALMVATVLWRLKMGGKLTPLPFGLTIMLAFWLLIPVHDWLENHPSTWQQKGALCVKPIFWLGTFSYSIYLVHFNLHKLVSAVLAPLVPTTSIAVQLITPLLVCLACYPFYLVCERPFLNQKNSMANRDENQLAT